MRNLGHEFGTIVEQRLKALGKRAFTVETEADLPPDSIRNVMRAQNPSGPTLSKVQQICEALGLELYIGPPRDHGPQPPEADPSALAQIPLHEAMLAAGDGAENGTEHISDYLAFRKDWLRKIGLSPSNAVLARVTGNSMQPVIWEGDMLLIDRSKIEPPPIAKPDRSDRFAPVFALLDSGMAKVKRLQMLDQTTAVLISDNPEYPPQFAKAETLSIIGKVVWWGHTSRE